MTSAAVGVSSFQDMVRGGWEGEGDARHAFGGLLQRIAVGMEVDLQVVATKVGRVLEAGQHQPHLFG